MHRLLAMTSAAEARNAVKMAGLPVFFMGIQAVAYAAVQCLTMFAGVTADGGLGLWEPLAIAIIGIILIAMGLGLRRARAILVLPAFGIVVVYFAWAAVAQPIYTLIVPLMMLLLTTNGLRGWLWLRRNKNLGDVF